MTIIIIGIVAVILIAYLITKNNMSKELELGKKAIRENHPLALSLAKEFSETSNNAINSDATYRYVGIMLKKTGWDKL